MKRKYLIIAVVFWLLLIVVGIYFYNKPHRNAAAEKTDVHADAVALYSQFQQSEAAANQKFLDKIIEVKGKIADIQESGNNITVLLDAGPVPGGVNCSFTNAEHNIQLPAKGTLITVKGKCTGFLMDVNLVDCVFTK
ncbi:MAG: hypothetical protein ACHQET_04595 [Chitinophagales bacterium]